MADNNLRDVAYHEAGHAVAHYLLRLPFDYISVMPDPERNTVGHVMGGVILKEIRDYGDASSGRAHLWLEKAIMGQLAGPVAEERIGNKDDHGNSGDFGHAADLALTLSDGQEEEASALVAWLWERTKNLLGIPHHWAMVEALAGELQRTPYMSARRARKVIALAGLGEKGGDHG